MLGEGFMSTAVTGIVDMVIQKFTKTGIAIGEAKKGDGDNPVNWWRITMGVKKYGALGVPMDFAGAELITGLMEMVVDAINKVTIDAV